MPYHAIWIQDDWRVSDRLTLNAQGGNYNLSADWSNNQYVDRPPAGVQASYADRLLLLADGRIVHDGSAESPEAVLDLIKAVA